MNTLQDIAQKIELDLNKKQDPIVKDSAEKKAKKEYLTEILSLANQNSSQVEIFKIEKTWKPTPVVRKKFLIL